MKYTTPEQFLKKYISKAPEDLIKRIEEGLKAPFRVFRDKIVIVLYGYEGVSDNVLNMVRDKYIKAGWKNVESNSGTNASYSGYIEIYLYFPTELGGQKCKE